jgi:predicted dehydrogenase
VAVNVLLVGAGRMGLRHLAGLAGLDGELHVVDPRPEARAQAAERGARTWASLEDAPLGGMDAAILGETAAGRLERLETLAGAGVRHVLAEKPLEQSRARVRQMAEIADGLDVRVNHHHRTVAFIRELRERGGPFRIAVTGGAYGLACNGIHELDLACFLTGAPGRVGFVELDETPIGSGRGPGFRDYGGRVLVRFDDGSSLYLDSAAESSAPVLVSIVRRDGLVVSDGTAGIRYERDPSSTEPAFRYGLAYERREGEPFDRVDLPAITAAWLGSLRGAPDPGLPALAEALPAHELLFDILETTGGTEFPIT